MIFQQINIFVKTKEVAHYRRSGSVDTANVDVALDDIKIRYENVSLLRQEKLIKQTNHRGNSKRFTTDYWKIVGCHRIK